MNFFIFLRDNARWLAGGFLLTFFSSFGQTFFIALSAGQIRGEFDLSHGEFGTLYMAATLASALTLPRLGRIVDRIPVSRVTLLSVPDAGARSSGNGIFSVARDALPGDLRTAPVRAGHDDPHRHDRDGQVVRRPARPRGFRVRHRREFRRGVVSLGFCSDFGLCRLAQFMADGGCGAGDRGACPRSTC